MRYNLFRGKNLKKGFLLLSLIQTRIKQKNPQLINTHYKTTLIINFMFFYYISKK